jgi:hypothetical protein
MLGYPRSQQKPGEICRLDALDADVVGVFGESCEIVRSGAQHGSAGFCESHDQGIDGRAAACPAAEGRGLFEI